MEWYSVKYVLPEEWCKTRRCYFGDFVLFLYQIRSAGCWIKGTYHGIFGYSDDNFLLAPSLSALQEMLKSCEEYARLHNLKFSTHPLPKKCKTKCIAFLKKKRDLPNLKLCGNNLPWVNSGKHLGNTIESKINGMQLDLKQKRAAYISKNNELLQEFGFSHPETLLKVNSIYNTHFTGSPLWNIFSEEAIKLENTWNKSIRLMLDVPINTHRNLIEPLSGQLHLKKVLVKRFLSFVAQIEKCPKSVPKHLLKLIQWDVRSTTGENLRKIMLLVGKSSIEEITLHDFKSVKYHEISDAEKWKTVMIKELIDIKFGKLQVGNISDEETEEIINFLCTS